MANIYQNILIIAFLLTTVFIYFKQLLIYHDDFKVIFILILIIVIIAMSYESRESGCNFLKCQDEDVIKIISKNYDDLACKEMSRVCWRRAIILSFVVLLILNIFYKDNQVMNLMIFICVWFLLYFWFNFDQYHRFRVLCKNLNKKEYLDLDLNFDSDLI